jgi:hypothetical protein
MSNAPQRSQEPVQTLPPRRLVGISELDSRLQDEITQYGSLKVFRITMWRDEPDETGCNWNARIDRLNGTEEDDSSWWHVVPQLRQRFNLL